MWVMPKEGGIRSFKRGDVMENDEMNKISNTGNHFIKVQYIKHSHNHKFLSPPMASLYIFPATAS